MLKGFPWVKAISVSIGSVIAYQSLWLPNSFAAEIVFGIGMIIAFLPFILAD